MEEEKDRLAEKVEKAAAQAAGEGHVACQHTPLLIYSSLQWW